MNIRRPKLKEFHHGKPIFQVWVGPDRGRTKLEARMQESLCLGRPYDAKIFRNEVSLFIEVRRQSTFFDNSYYDCKTSLGDSAVVWHGGRNLHRMFTKRKHAERYMNRINSGCLSAAERNHLAYSLKFGLHY
uniref:Uncharacterized protein n=1 Tax=Pseudomonas phage RVTF4 TaxID=3236931 RepID=A0AB39CD58_9VIRU